MLRGERCQEKEEKCSSALIHEVPRNICMVLIKQSLCKAVCLWIICFLFNPLLPQGVGKKISLSVGLRKRHCNEEVSCCHKY